MEAPLVSVVIVNYNGSRYLKGCLDSLAVALDVPHEIVMVDNASKDDSVAFVRENYPEVVLIDAGENLGFGRGNNLGVTHAKGKYVLLLNNDTIVLDRLAPLLGIMERDKTIGVAGINMLDGQKRMLMPGGRFPDVRGMYRMKTLFDLGPEFVSGRFSRESYDIDWLGGSFLLMEKALYERVGGFDEAYFMYVEDVDLCRKIADEGLRRVFFPQFRYIHFVGFSNAKNPLLIKGFQMYIGKHLTGHRRFLTLAALRVNQAVKRLKSLWPGRHV